MVAVPLHGRAAAAHGTAACRAAACAERRRVEQQEIEREMLNRRLAPALPYVKPLFVGWFKPLRDAIARDQDTLRRKRVKHVYAKYLLQGTHYIGEAVEREFKVQSLFHKSRKKKDHGENDPALEKEQAKCLKRVKGLVKRRKMNEAQKLAQQKMELEEWGTEA